MGGRRRKSCLVPSSCLPLPVYPSTRLFLVMKLVLFDIDGTLLWTDGAGRRAIHRALLEETGTAGPIETYRFDGKTDPQIVRELLALAGHPDAADGKRVEAVCRRYVGLLSAELAKPTQATQLMVGIAELLAALEPHERADRAVVGLLTGNVEPGAALKLRSAGLDPDRFRVGAYGSDSHRRADLPALAAQRDGARSRGRARASSFTARCSIGASIGRASWKRGTRCSGCASFGRPTARPRMACWAGRGRARSAGTTVTALRSRRASATPMPSSRCSSIWGSRSRCGSTARWRFTGWDRRCSGSSGIPPWTCCSRSRASRARSSAPSRRRVCPATASSRSRSRIS